MARSKSSKDAAGLEQSGFGRFFHNNPLSVWVLDQASLGFLEVNETATKVYGYSRVEFLKMSFSQLFPATDTTTIEQIQRGKSFSGECTHQKKNGELISVEINSTVIEFSERPAFLMIVKELSDRRQVEEELANNIRKLEEAEQMRAEGALQESEDRFRVTFEQAAVGLSISSRGPLSNFARVNQKLCEITGYSQEELLTKSVRDITYPDDFEKNLEYTEKLMRGEISTFSMEKRYIRKDGSLIWADLTVSVIKNPDGSPKYFVAVSQDINARKQAEEKLQRRMVDLEALHEVGVGLNSTLDPQTIGEKIIQVLAERLDWHHAAIRLRREESDDLELLAFSFPEYTPQAEERLQKMVRKVGEGLTGWVVEHGQTVRISPLKDDPRYAETYIGMQSGLYVPLINRGRCIGCIGVESEERDAFNESDERLMVTLASQAATAIENARLYQNTLRASRRREILYRASGDIARASQNLEEVYATVHQSAMQLIPADVFVITLVDDARREIRGVYLVDRGIRNPEIRSPMGQGITGYVLKTGQAYRVGDQTEDHAVKPIYFGATSEEHTRSILAVPIRQGNSIIGVISAQSYFPHIYNRDDEELLEMLASFSGVAIRNAQLFEQTRMRLEELATISKVSSAIRISEKRDEIVATVLKQVTGLLKVPHACLIAYEEKTGENLIELGLGDWATASGIRIPAHKGLAGFVAETMQTYVTDDVRKEKRLYHQELFKGLRSVVGIPMLVQDKILGSLWIGRSETDGMVAPFNSMEISLLSSIANIVASALNRVSLHEQAVHHAAQMAAIGELGRALAETPNLESMYHKLALMICDLLPDIGNLFISRYDKKRQSIICVCAQSDGNFIDHTTLPVIPLALVGQGHQSTVIQIGEPLILDDLDKGTPTESQILLGDKHKQLKSALYVPMITHNEVIGLIQVQSATPGRFMENDAKLLSLVANTGAVEIENARLLEETRHRAAQLMRINDLGRTLAETLDLEEIYQKLAQIALDLVPGSSTIFISLFDAATRLFHAVYSIHDDQVADISALPPAELLPPGKGTQSECIHTGKPAIFPDLEEFYRQNNINVVRNGSEGPTTQSSVCVPMIAHGKAIGVMQLQSYEKGYYTDSDAETFSLVANTAAVAIENARLFTQIERQLEQLSSLRTIDATINSNTSLNTTLSIILDHVRIQLGVDAADILLHNPQTMMFEFAEGKGFRTKDVQKSALYIGKGHLGRAIFENRTIFSNKLAEDSEFARRGLITSEQFVAHCVSPLVSKGKIKGVLEVFHRSPLEENREWITFLEMLANEAAIAIDNIQMFQELQQSNLELVMAYDATIDSLAQALDLRDAETGGHSRHVVDLTLKLARSLGIQGGALAHIRRGSMLHDIGKMGVPDILLRKPGPLTEEEWVIMRQHPILAHTLMSRIPYLRQALDIPYCHHEKWDGSGYPRGLKGEEIPLAARIFAAADVYDVMTSDRPYRKALTEQEALDYIRSQAGKHFDPKVAQAFLGMLESETD